MTKKSKIQKSHHVLQLQGQDNEKVKNSKIQTYSPAPRAGWRKSQKFLKSNNSKSAKCPYNKPHMDYCFQLRICKMPAPPHDHLQKASRSEWSFEAGLPLQMIICKRPAHPDDHLHLSFVIVCCCLSLLVVFLLLFVVFCCLLSFVVCCCLFAIVCG